MTEIDRKLVAVVVAVAVILLGAVGRFSCFVLR